MRERTQYDNTIISILFLYILKNKNIHDIYKILFKITYKNLNDKKNEELIKSFRNCEVEC